MSDDDAARLQAQKIAEDRVRLEKESARLDAELAKIAIQEEAERAQVCSQVVANI